MKEYNLKGTKWLFVLPASLDQDLRWKILGVNIPDNILSSEI